MNATLGGPQGCSERFGKEKNTLTVRTLTPNHPARSLVAISTTISRLPVFVEIRKTMNFRFIY
jgi:hypothetical protein